MTRKLSCLSRQETFLRDGFQVWLHFSSDNFLVVSGYYFVLIYDIITYLNTIIYKHIFNIIYFAPSL